MRSSLKAILLAGAVVGTAVVGGTAALASGGAGGMSGGTTAPSAGPQYDPAAEYAKAVAAMQAKQYRDAARAAQRVTDAAPSNADAWRLLGAARAGDNDWKGSRHAFERAVKLTPDDASSHAGLGLALANLKDPKVQEQIDWLKAKTQACGDTCPDAANLKAMTDQVQAAAGGAGAAPAQPSAMLDHSMLFSGPAAGDAAYIHAVSLINEKRYDEALASLAGAAAVFGPHPDILTYQGYAWRKKGDLDKAESFYRQALAIAPNHIGATEYYGELKVARGDIAGAKVMLARLDKLCTFGCPDQEELRRWIALGHEPPQH